MQGRHVGVFGGSFDPPHLGHCTVAQSLVEEKVVDEVWFVPVKQHPLGKDVSLEHHRVEMVRLLVEETLQNPKYQLNTIELRNSGPSYSLKTLQLLADEYTDTQFSWIMGSDNLPSFHTWWHYQELLNSFPVLVYPREGHPQQPWYEQMTWLSQLPTIAISSTDVRQKVKKGLAIEELVGKEIATYIKEHGLYR